MTNPAARAAKHSGSARVSLRLDLACQPACLEIQDYGRGFNPQAAMEQRGHLGVARRARRPGHIRFVPGDTS